MDPEMLSSVIPPMGFEILGFETGVNIEDLVGFSILLIVFAWN